MLLNSMAESIPNRGAPSICQGSSYGGAIHFLLTGMERVQVSGIPETWEFLRGLELAGIFFGAVYLEFVIVGHAGNLQPARLALQVQQTPFWRLLHPESGKDRRAGRQGSAQERVSELPNLPNSKSDPKSLTS